MPGPICVKLLEFVEGRWAIHLGQKKIKKIFLKKFFFEVFFFEEVFCLQPNPTSSLHACRVDSLGFEDCRLATHLLNYYL